MDRPISNGNFAESAMFSASDSAKFPLLIDLSTRDSNFLPTSSGQCLDTPKSCHACAARGRVIVLSVGRSVCLFVCLQFSTLSETG